MGPRSGAISNPSCVTTGSLCGRTQPTDSLDCHTLGFVVCARLNKKEAILKGFESRLKHAREKEIKTALAEIEKIAYLRLQDIIES